jgi:hypothetical protein
MQQGVKSDFIEQILNHRVTKKMYDAVTFSHIELLVK